MKLKRIQVVEIHKALGGLVQYARGAKVAYALSKNSSKLRSEAEAFERARLAVCASLSKKDDDGQPMTEAGSFVFADAYTATRAIEEQMRPLGEEEIDVELHRIPLALIEADGAFAKDSPLGAYLEPLVGTVIEE